MGPSETYFLRPFITGSYKLKHPIFNGIFVPIF